MGPSAFSYNVGVPEEDSYAAEYPDRTFPFDTALASGSASLGADVAFFTWFTVYQAIRMLGDAGCPAPGGPLLRVLVATIMKLFEGDRRNIALRTFQSSESAK
jgi:hypothetical protein